MRESGHETEMRERERERARKMVKRGVVGNGEGEGCVCCCCAENAKNKKSDYRLNTTGKQALKCWYKIRPWRQ